MGDTTPAASLDAAAKDKLKDCSRYVFFDGAGVVLAASFQVSPTEVKALAALYGDRDDAIRRGMVIQGSRYEVHRFHPPLIYGRTMGGEPESSEGAALCRVEQGSSGAPCYGAATYQMPNISARMVPILQQFCNEHLQPKT